MSAERYLGLAGARVVQTRSLLLSDRAIRDVLSARALGVLHGPAGSGTTSPMAVGSGSSGLWSGLIPTR